MTVTLDNQARTDYSTTFYVFQEATAHWTDENTLVVIGTVQNGNASGTFGTFTYPRERVISVVES